jgi:hypothetical protein
MLQVAPPYSACQRRMDEGCRVPVAQSAKYPKGITPVFGNIYLQANRERILKRIRDRREGLSDGAFGSQSRQVAAPLRLRLAARNEHFHAQIKLSLGFEVRQPSVHLVSNRQSAFFGECKIGLRQ